MPAWVPFPLALRGPGPFYTSWTMGALIIHMLSRFDRAAASQRSCFLSERSLCSMSPWPQDWKGLRRGHEARAVCANNHISERSGRVTELLSNQGDSWSGFSGQNSQCAPLSQNPLSVELLTLSRMSRSALQVIWKSQSEWMRSRWAAGSSEDVKPCWCFRSWLDCNLSLIPTPSLCPRSSHFTLLFGIVCLHHQYITLSISSRFCPILYLSNKKKNTAKQLLLFSFFSCFFFYGYTTRM